jgi:hypothetical protein
MQTTTYRHLVPVSSYRTKSGTRHEYGLPAYDLDTLLSMTEADADAIYAELRQAYDAGELHRYGTLSGIAEVKARGHHADSAQRTIYHLWSLHSTAGEQRIRQTGRLWQHMAHDGMTFADAYRTTAAEYAAECQHQMTTRTEGSFDPVMGTGRKTTIHSCVHCGYERRTDDVRRWSGD